MATNLGTLTLNLLANTGSYTQGLQRAERQTQESTENMSEGFDLVGKSVAALTGIVAGISVAGVIAFAAETINAGNEIKKLADLSNAPIQQFQYWAVGAKTAGIEIDQFADQMKDMQDRIGDFQQTGGGPLADFFTNIAPLVGVTIEQFQKLSGPDAIQLFYSSLQKVFATENDIKFYMEAIISDSSKLIPLLRDGGKGFQEWGDRAKEAGAIMSNDMVKQLSDAKENLQILDFKWKGFKTTLINDAMPAFTAISENIDTVTNVMMVGGAFLAGAYIPTIYGAITALGEKVAAQFADVQATQLANEVTAQRAARLLHLTEIELNNARVQAARLTGMARLAFIERTLIPLEQQHTAAVAANTVAQNANNVSKSIAARVAGGLSAIIGGPVGLGLLVAGAAASYLLLRDNTDKATKSLNENGIAVADVVTKYQQLTEAQQRTQLRAETKSLTDLTDGYKDAKNKLFEYVVNIEKYGYVSAEASEVVGELALKYRNGEITAEALAAKINALSGVSDKAKVKIDEQTGVVSKAKVAMDQQKDATLAMIQANEKLAQSHVNVSESAKKHLQEMMKLNAEQKAYVLKVQSDTVSEKFVQDQIKSGVPRERAEFRRDAYMGANVDLAKPSEVPNLVKDAEMEAWALNQREKAREEAEKKAEDAAKKREAAREKARNDAEKKADDAEKLREQQFQDREDIYYKYASREMKIEQDLQKEISKIQKSNFSPKDSAGYIQNAQMRSGLEIQLYQAQLDAELDDWKSTEQEKLNQKVYINELMIQLDADMNDKQKQQAMQSLIARSNQELAWMKLEEAQRISDAGEALRTDLQNIEIKYAFERKKIEENAQLSDDERQKRLALSFASEDHQKRQNLKSATAAWGGTYADLTGTGAQYQIEQDRFNKYDESQALFDAQMALADSAAEREAIWQAHNDRMAMIDQDYWGKTKSYQLGMASDVFGGLAGIMLNFVDESSGSYRTLVAIQKGANLASVLMNSITAISAAWASAPFPYNLPAVGMATLETGALQATLQAFTPQGFATGGHIKGQGSGTSDEIPIWASNGEFMIRAAAVEKLGLANLDYINRTGMLPPRFADGGLINNDIMKTKTIGNTPSKGVDYNVMQTQQQQEQSVSYPFTVNNVFDLKDIPDVMATPAGTNVFLNFVRLNKSKIRGMLGVS